MAGERLPRQQENATHAPEVTDPTAEVLRPDGMQSSEPFVHREEVGQAVVVEGTPDDGDSSGAGADGAGSTSPVDSGSTTEGAGSDGAPTDGAGEAPRDSSSAGDRLGEAPTDDSAGGAGSEPHSDGASGAGDTSGGAGDREPGPEGTVGSGDPIGGAPTDAAPDSDNSTSGATGNTGSESSGSASGTGAGSDTQPTDDDAGSDGSSPLDITKRDDIDVVDDGAEVTVTTTLAGPVVVTGDTRDEDGEKDTDEAEAFVPSPVAVEIAHAGVVTDAGHVADDRDLSLGVEENEETLAVAVKPGAASDEADHLVTGGDRSASNDDVLAPVEDQVVETVPAVDAEVAVADGKDQTVEAVVVADPVVEEGAEVVDADTSSVPVEDPAVIELKPGVAVATVDAEVAVVDGASADDTKDAATADTDEAGVDEEVMTEAEKFDALVESVARDTRDVLDVPEADLEAVKSDIAEALIVAQAHWDGQINALAARYEDEGMTADAASARARGDVLEMAREVTGYDVDSPDQVSTAMYQAELRAPRATKANAAAFKQANPGIDMGDINGRAFGLGTGVQSLGAGEDLPPFTQRALDRNQAARYRETQRARAQEDDVVAGIVEGPEPVVGETVDGSTIGQQEEEHVQAPPAPSRIRTRAR